MIEIRTDTVVRRHSDASYRMIEGAALIVMPREAKLLTLNQVGSRVWELLEKQTAAQVARAIAEEFDVGYDDALQDTLRFLAKLFERGMVVAETEGGPWQRT